MLFSPRLALHVHPLRKLLNKVTSVMIGNEDDGCDEGGGATRDYGVGDDLPPSWW